MLGKTHVRVSVVMHDETCRSRNQRWLVRRFISNVSWNPQSHFISNSGFKCHSLNAVLSHCVYANLHACMATSGSINSGKITLMTLSILLQIFYFSPGSMWGTYLQNLLIAWTIHRKKVLIGRSELLYVPCFRGGGRMNNTTSWELRIVTEFALEEHLAEKQTTTWFDWTLQHNTYYGQTKKRASHVEESSPSRPQVL